LDFLGMSAKADTYPVALSGGEQQRVSIVRAMFNRPAFLIADEPTAHLDTKLSYEFMGFMKRLKDEGRTIIIASHDPVVYESGIVDRIVNMRDGRIID
ncbi:MAG: ATP-binding cassette domain-containing protein, partial [Nitrospirae bacterium]|nr:ATP-binding cassette domain-containing protein [Nitrospirota bacterium]